MSGVRETPRIEYRLEDLESARERVATAIPGGSELYYSLKANPHPALVRQLVRLGCGVDVTSVGELETVAAVAPEARVLLTGPAHTVPLLRRAMRHQVRTVSIESLEQYSLLADVAAASDWTPDVLLRVNATSPPGSRMRMTGRPSQFGTDEDQLITALAQGIAHEGPPIRGLHYYPASNVSDSNQLLRSFIASIDSAERIHHATGFTPAVLDLGGGFPAAYGRAAEQHSFAGLAEGIAARLHDAFPHSAPDLIFESGRALVGPAGVLITSVIDVKRSYGQDFVIIDTGINHIGGMAGLGRALANELEPRVVVPARSERTEITEAVIAGPLCTPSDILARRATALDSVAVGDLLAVPNMGAYGPTASLVAFLGHDAPLEVVIKDGEVIHRSRLTVMRRDA